MSARGQGAVDQAAAVGSEWPAAQAVNAVTVTISGVNAPVTSAGLVPGSMGLYQIAATAPRGVAAGDGVPVQITVAGQLSPAVTMAIH